MNLANQIRGLATAMVLLAAGSVRPLTAQRPVVRGNDLWTTVTAEQRIAPHTLISAFLDFRRAEVGQLPRQVLWNTAVMHDIGHGLRFGVGYGQVHTSPDEALAVDRASFEHRVFEQVTGSHRNFGLSFSHRLRLEHRWIRPEPEKGADPDWSYTSRVRHQLRIVAPLDGRAPSESRWYAVPSVEVLVTTFNHQPPFFGQSRIGAALGKRVARRLNVEAGYVRQSQIRGDGFHEFHNVLQLWGRISTG